MDSKRLAEIAEVMEGRGLTRVRVEESDGSAIELERGVERQLSADPVVSGPVPASALAPLQACAPASAAPGAVSAVAPDTGAPDAGAPDAAANEVRAPMVGVFYAAPAPGDEPFVRVGSKVKAGETLCIIEAMKVLNEVSAETDGEVVEICVADGELVEYGSCIMRIR